MTDQQPKEVLLELHELEGDVATQSRETIDQETVERYGELMRQGVKFDPIDVFFDGVRYWRADGWHRSAGAEWAGKKSILCRVYQGTKEDAVVFACGANARHGKAMSNADKRKCVTTLLKLRPEWSDRAIAEHVGCGNQMVGVVRKEVCDSHTSEPSLSEQLAKRLGKDGKSYPATQPSRVTVAPHSPDDDLEDGLDEEDLEDVDHEADLLAEVQEPFRRWQQVISKLSSELRAYAADPQMGRVLSDKITRLTTDLQGVRACIRQAEWVGRCECDGGCQRCRQTGFVWRALVQVEGPEA